MLYEVYMTKGPDWTLNKSREIGASNISEGKEYIYSITLNHACVQKMKDEINIGNFPVLKFVLPARGGYEQVFTVTNYAFWWKQDQSGSIAKADIKFSMAHLDGGSLGDLGNNSTKFSIIFKKA